MKQQTLPWGWIGFFFTLILLALVTSFALISAGKQLAEQEVPKQNIWRLIINGKTYHAPQQVQEKLADETNRIIQRQQAQLTRQIQQHIAQQLDDVFSPVHAKVPEFTDWYYSLTAEYMRYAQAIGGNISGYLQDQLLQRVFEPAQLESAIDGLPAAVNSSLNQLLSDSRQTITRQLQSMAASHSIQYLSESMDISSQLSLDPLLNIEPELNQQVINRQLINAVAATGVGVVAGKGLGALVVKKSLAKMATSKSFLAASGLLAKLAAKSALKGGGSLGAAATGMVICSPTGPGALLCGVIAGVAAWVAVDAAIINLDELLNREVFEAYMHTVISQQQNKLLDVYSEAYSALLAAHFLQLHQAGTSLLNPPGTFVPAESIRR